jgi:hypothetical protein
LKLSFASLHIYTFTFFSALILFSQLAEEIVMYRDVPARKESERHTPGKGRLQFLLKENCLLNQLRVTSFLC